MVACLADEIAFWTTDEGGANPDHEVLNAVRPAMATVPGSMLLCASSPYARRGALWESYHPPLREGWRPAGVAGRDAHDEPDREPRPTSTGEYEKDPVSAAAEFGANSAPTSRATSPERPSRP